MKPAITKYLCICFLSGLIFLLLLPCMVSGQKNYSLRYYFYGKDSLNSEVPVSLQTAFASKELAQQYLSSIPSVFFSKGFAAASVDSVRFDTTFASVYIYTGAPYLWMQIHTDSVEQEVLTATGWNEKQFRGRAIDFATLQRRKENIIAYYANTGYPFATVSLNNISLQQHTVAASLSVTKGPLYHIDSIRIFGKAKIKNLFLQHYLGISNGSLYNRDKLARADKLINELAFVQQLQPSDVSMLGSGSILNLYLDPRKSSEVNVLIGFAPGNTITGKTSITADVHLNLKNALGGGEGILLNWQQLQPQSPRLNLAYNRPYIFNSGIGVDLSFDLLKKDSAYLQLNGLIGLQYALSYTQTLRIFYQAEQDYLLGGGIDTLQVIYSRKLPENMDVKTGSIGIGYHFVNTNYRLNPRKGNEVDVVGAAGIRRTFRNNDITGLTDPLDPDFDFSSLYDSVDLKTYQLRINASASHYFALGKSSTLKAAANIGVLQSPQTFRNELFRIGGNKILRGFDEESIYANRYGVFTAEYRYLTGVNSYFFGFTDIGFTGTAYNGLRYNNSFISAGVGLAFETKFGLLNLSYAAGKRNDVQFDIRNASKIHFGYISYF